MIPTALWFFLAFVALSYIATPLFLRALRTNYSELQASLGEPRFGELFSRNPDNWRKQFRFARFVLSGQAYFQTGGAARSLAALVFIAQAGSIGALAALLAHLAHHA